jgi:hypothetical protein
VDVLLELLLLGAVTSGLVSWAMGTGWSKVATVVHALCGFGVVGLAAAKVRGSVRVGLRRRRPSRWLSVLFGGLVVATISLGVLHATGQWFGVGYWSALWTHVLLAFVLIPLYVWHVLSRPDRPRLADLDRRAVLRGGVVLAAGAAAYGVQEAAVRAAGLAGGDRRFTGSHEAGSFAPDRMPTVSWIDDAVPASTDPAGWRLDVLGDPVDVRRLADRSRPVTATVDCTGGWWSTQAWDAVPLRDLLGDRSARSVAVTSSTGYSRLFPYADVDDLYLAIGYGGEPLRPGHGAPVRLVAPGRRGPWWVKWVTSVRFDDRPWWLQTPFPLE